MKTLFTKIILAIFFVGFVTQIEIAAADKQPSDTWIDAQIVTSYLFSRHLNPFDISTSVNNGVVTLKGSVESDIQRDLAEQVAYSVDGVKKVDNQLKVDEKVVRKTPDPATPGLASKIEDATITASVKTKLLTNRNTHGMKINVDTKGRVVTLSGTLRSDSESELAEQLAENTSGVENVINKIQVAAGTPPAENAAEKAGTAVSDTWISTKVRSLLLFSNDYPGSDVAVTTDKGIVVLEGKALTSEQKQRIGEMVNDVVGVKDVQNRLQVKSPSV